MKKNEYRLHHKNIKQKTDTKYTWAMWGLKWQKIAHYESIDIVLLQLILRYF